MRKYAKTMVMRANSDTQSRNETFPVKHPAVKTSQTIPSAATDVDENYLAIC